MKNYQAGVNLGGWISQYGKNGTPEHFNTFVTEKDIEKIASWKMDHIRLPVDYPVIEDDENPFTYKEEGLNYIRKCIDWCKKYGLNVILDLHRSPGYSFNTIEENSLFDDVEKQQRFFGIWRKFAAEFKNERDNVIFELLNEVVEPDSSRWNALVKTTVEVIREVDPTRKIIVGSNRYNSIFTLDELDILEDPNIIYTFHFYEPILFTHQGAHWTEVAVQYNRKVKYPGKLEGLEEFIKNHPKHKDWFRGLVGIEINKELLENMIQIAVNFREKTGAPLYCGEYGVIDNVEEESKLNWYRDFIDIMKQHDIGRTAWSYKEMDFGLVDINGNVINQKLVDIVSSK